MNLIRLSVRYVPLHGSLEFCERANHLHHHSACWRCRVDRLCETAKTCLRFLNPLHNCEHIPQGSRKPVQLPDDQHVSQHVSFREMIEQSLQLGTIPTAPGSLLAEDSFAASCLQSGSLRCRVLFVRRNACVANEDDCGKVSPMTLSLQYVFATQFAGLWACLEIVA